MKNSSLAPLPTSNFAKYAFPGIILFIYFALIIFESSPPIFEDDFYYYFVIAKNIVNLGESSFTAGIKTNGYHPLWLFFLTLLGVATNFSLVAVRLAEFILCFMGSVLFLWAFPLQSLARTAVFSVVISVAARKVALNGMESSLLLLTGSFFLVAILSKKSAVVKRRQIFIPIAACAVAATRLDSTILIIPVLFFALIPISVKIRALLLMSFCGTVYASLNYFLFGTALPVSAEIKSLGGYQINEAYVDQVMATLGSGLGALGRSEVLTIALPILGLLCCLIEYQRFQKLSSVTRVLLGLSLGTVCYLAKILLGSSWRVWSWYGFPIIVLSQSLFLFFDRWTPVFRFKLEALVATLLFFWFALGITRHEGYEGFHRVTREFLHKYEDRFQGAMLAMGDRAGSLSYLYLPRSVFQLEGLVGSESYLNVIKRGGNINDYLCKVGVRIIVDYWNPNATLPSRSGESSRMDIDVYRSRLTSFTGPFVTVWLDDLIAAHSNIIAFDNSSIDDGDSTVAAWALRCP